MRRRGGGGGRREREGEGRMISKCERTGRERGEGWDRKRGRERRKEGW